MEKTLLDTLGDRIDTRVGVIAALQTLLTTFQNNSSEDKKPFSLDGNKLIIITNFASIACEIITDNTNDQELTTAQLIVNTVLKANDELYKTFPPDTPIINNSKTLILRNAQIIPFACPQKILNYEVFTIFTDQIVGVTIGSFNQNPD